MGEYIDEELKKKLMEKFGLSILPEKTGIKRKNEDGGEEVENENSNKKTKTSNEDNVPLEDYGSKANGTPAKVGRKKNRICAILHFNFNVFILFFTRLFQIGNKSNISREGISESSTRISFFVEILFI